MKRLNIVFLFIICCSLVTVSRPMEQKEETARSGFEALPPELQLLIAQYLGPTTEKVDSAAIEAAIKDLLTLSEVNKQFNSLLKSEPNLIARVIEQKFGKQKIMETFRDYLVYGGNLDKVVRFIKLHLFTLGDLLAFEQKNDWLPHILRKRRLAHGWPESQDQANHVYRDLDFLLEHKFIKPDYDYFLSEREAEATGLQKQTGLYDAALSKDRRWWDLLIKHHADVFDPKNARAVALARELGWIS